MKKFFSTFFLFAFVLIFTACSDDDVATVTNTNDYFPLAVNNSWNFDNEFSATGQGDTFGSETLFINSTAQMSGNAVFELDSSDPQNSGLSTIILQQGVLYKDNFNLMYTGEFGIDIPEFSNLSFNLSDVQVYNANLSPGSVLFIEETTFNEQYEGLPITLNFKISTVMGESFEEFTVNNTTYQDVISSEWVIELEVLSTVGLATVIILENQEASKVTNYFAKDVGMIKSESSTTLDFEEIAIIPLEDVNSSSLQELTSYSVTLD